MVVIRCQKLYIHVTMFSHRTDITVFPFGLPLAGMLHALLLRSLFLR